jgi:SP family galactose:H+ symporter-like MFS transporter
MTDKASSGRSLPDLDAKPQTLHTSGFVVVVSVIAAIGGLLFGYDTGVISGAILFIRQTFSLTPTTEGMTVSAVLVGAVIGAALGGILGDHYGRKKMIILAAIIFGIGAIVTAITPNLPILIFGRVTVGVGIGLASFIAPMYISEVAPPAFRGALVFLNQLAVTFGILISYGVDYLLTAAPGNWRWMLGLALIPALALGLGMLRMPNSPRWLVMRNQTADAKNVLIKIRGTQEVENELQDVQTSLRIEGSSSWSDLVKLSLRLPLAIGICIAVFQQITGINTVIYYAPTIIEGAGIKSDAVSILATTGIGFVNFFFTIVGMHFVDRAGRRPLLLISLFGMAIFLAGLALAFQVPELRQSLGVAVVVFLMGYVAAFAIGLGPVFWLLISEIYPDNIRAKAGSIATIANWGSNFIVALVFPILVGAIGQGNSFWVFALFTGLAIVFVYFLVPETKGRALDQIQQELVQEAKIYHL